MQIKFRDLKLEERLEKIISKFSLDKNLLLPKNYLEQSNSMIENSIGSIFIPLGLILNLKMNEQFFTVPLATEEASVIAACNFANKVVDGIFAKTINNLSLGNIYFKKTDLDILKTNKKNIENFIQENTTSMKNRGGGFSSLEFSILDKFVRVDFYFDCKDVMGANFINSILEKCSLFIYKELKVEGLFSILSNDYSKRISTANFKIKIEKLTKFLKHSNKSPEKLASDIVLLSKIAKLDSKRAVTHNKGIMNAISGLALATLNDTRAIEASIHLYACRNGKYEGLSTYWIKDDFLHAELSIPTAFATIGGSIKKSSQAKECLKIMNNPDSKTLSQIAVSIGLLQNFSALKAICSEGIQRGHMNLHKKEK